MASSREAFRPAWWLAGAHAQTVGARFLRPKNTVPLERQRWSTPDDDFLDLDFVRGNGLRGDVLVLLLHGLEGSAHSGYAFQFYRQLKERGIGCVGLNFRSCSGEVNRGMRLYHSGETSDPGWVIERLREKAPGRRLAAVGVSLGGNVLLKYLGESGSSSGIDAAAAMSIPFDLGAGARFMEQSMLPRIYVKRLLRTLKAKLVVRRRELGPLVDLEPALQAKTFREFDDAATAPLHGFDGADDYYERSSSAQFLGSIRTKTLIIHSEDDPFLPPNAIPRRAIDANPNITAKISAHGGHVGFAAGAVPFRPDFWAERTIATWLAKQF